MISWFWGKAFPALVVTEWQMLVGLAVLGTVLTLILRSIVLRSRRKAGIAKQDQIEELKASVRKLRESLLRMDNRLCEAEQFVRWRDPAIASGGNVDMTFRAKALRLYRLGQTPEQIAEQVRMPAGEAKFLFKVHQLVLDKLLDSNDGAKVEYEN